MEKRGAKKTRNIKSDGYTEKVIQIRRVNKVVKGGKRLAFRATVVVGDMNGKVSLGVGKATEVPNAIRKAIESAKKTMAEVKVTNQTVAHEVIGKFASSKVILKPAPKGTGVIAGGSARIILELAGIKNVVAKSQGSNNAINSARATINALLNVVDPQQIATLRGKEINFYSHGAKEVVKFAPIVEPKADVKKASKEIKEEQTVKVEA